MKIVYPRGGGGNWLGNTMHYLNIGRFVIPRVDTVFDGQRLGPIPVSHVFEVPDSSQPDQIWYWNSDPDRVLFSTNNRFNQWINTAHKNLEFQYGYDKQPLIERFFNLSNHCRWVMTDPIYHKYYCENIGLEYSDIFQQPAQFINNVYELMDRAGHKCTRNDDYMLASIENYKTTILHPEQILGNLDEIFWLAFCHSVSLSHGLTINSIITNDFDFKELQDAIEPISAECEKIAQAHMFTWTI